MTDNDMTDEERERLRVECDAAATKRARGMVAYVRKSAEKHGKLAEQSGGVGYPAGQLHDAQAHALRVVAAELEEFYT